MLEIVMWRKMPKTPFKRLILLNIRKQCGDLEIRYELHMLTAER